MKSTNRTIAFKARRIKMLLLDVDGVLTDGKIILDSRGNELKSFHVRDGLGIKLAQKAEIVVGLITGRTSEVVTLRARELGIQEVHQGAQNKIEVYNALLVKYSVADSEVAYMGDDVVDIDILRRVGLAATVSDADPSVRSHVDLVSKHPGGGGAVRELISLILKEKGRMRSS